uniref:CTLH domain-containing protein n=1 Tax=Meloidogyne enterolobii TaxID=390850 RepID=A0A6V7TXP2_MELEN|nr:unnamed protein product [Meloidogyne enterolobii]
MQTADEMIDANFGQKPFLFDMRSELKMAEKATMDNINAIELPAEKVLWMNSLVSNWMAHEGYSRALDALNRATGGGTRGELSQQLAKSDSQGSTITFDSKDSQSPTVAAEKVAEVVMNSMIGLLGGNGGENSSSQQPQGGGGGNVRRSVVRSVQEALYEEMEQRRILVRMVKKGQLADAIDKIEQLFPSLFETNRQLALLIKTQHFIEMYKEITKELPPLPQEHQQTNNLNENNSLSTRQQFNNNNNLSSPSPRPSSSRGGKRSASAVDDDDDFTMIPSSSNDEGKNLNSATDLHNPVKRRSSNEDNEHTNSSQQQNGNSTNNFPKRDDFMEISEESRDGVSSSSIGVTTLEAMSNGDGRSNECSLLVGTPPTSTTIIKEEDSNEFVSGNEDELELTLDGFKMEVENEDAKDELTEYGGFSTMEEQKQFIRYAPLLEYGQEISRFAMKMDNISNVGVEDGQSVQSCAALRHRMNAAFSLLCYRDPSHSNQFLFT